MITRNNKDIKFEPQNSVSQNILKNIITACSVQKENYIIGNLIEVFCDDYCNQRLDSDFRKRTEKRNACICEKYHNE